MTRGANAARARLPVWVWGALELLEHAILLDAARDDDAGGDAETLEREVDFLGRLRALELVELKRVAIDAVQRVNAPRDKGP